MTMPHEGTDYADNNVFVWETIQALTLKGLAYAYIGGFDQNCDGRGAIKTLIGCYKGTASMSCIKQSAYDKIDNAMYTGERRNFTFKNYIDKHGKAYQIISELGVVQDEEKKVSDFLHGIRDSSYYMNCAKALVIGSNAWRTDFCACTEYLSSFVTSAPNSISHNIAGIDGKRAGGRRHGHEDSGQNQYGHRVCGNHRRHGDARGQIHADTYTRQQ